MSADAAIKVENVSKNFRLPHDKNTSIKGAVLNFYKQKRTFETQRVLKNVSFEVKKGEFFGIVGRNGSGKSTLLKMLAGIYTPSDGNISVEGKLTPFIELGVGFSPELTGRENVFLNGALLGLGRLEMEKLYPEIVEFAGLKKFMDQKLKNYSSGMQVRLAFSIAIRAKSDILILDEVLAVGDAAFQRKCYDYFMSLKKNKRTVVLVTHDMGAVRQYCDRAIMIEQGVLEVAGSPEAVAQEYQKLFTDDATHNRKIQVDKNKSRKAPERWGEGQLQAENFSATVNADKVVIETAYQAYGDVDAPVYGFTVHNQKGENIVESNTLKERLTTKRLVEGQRVRMKWSFPNILATGEYSVSIAVCDKSTTRFYDWVNEAVYFSVTKENATSALVEPPVEIFDYEHGDES